MQIFLDSGIVEELTQLNHLGIIDGVTTNPSLIKKSGRPRDEVIKDFCQLAKGPVSAEVISTDTTGMLNEAYQLAKISPKVVIKLPLTEAGISACHQLTQDQIKTNVTLCFSPLQATLAAKVGATYISPFVGRLDDIAITGMELIKEIKTIYDHYQYTTQILVASIRHLWHLKEAALLGAQVVTVPATVIKQMFKHPLTESGLIQFLSDANSSTSKPSI